MRGKVQTSALPLSAPTGTDIMGLVYPNRKGESGRIGRTTLAFFLTSTRLLLLHINSHQSK